MLRVIGGTCKGRRLRYAADPRIRPMPDKLKGALFNVIGDRVPGRRVLDGFAGTGSIGLEALSRGASRAVFVEEYPPALRMLRTNIERCGLESRAVVENREFNRAVIALAKQGVDFDLIFLDPPYRLLDERNPLKVVRKRGVLRPGGLIVLRRHRKTKPRLGDFPLRRELTLGDDTLMFFEAPRAAEARPAAGAAPAGETASAGERDAGTPPRAPLRRSSKSNRIAPAREGKRIRRTP